MNDQTSNKVNKKLENCVFHSPFGDVELDRVPPDPANTLRAWDAADEYLLQEVAEKIALGEIVGHSQKLSILINNDPFGALSSALAAHDIVCWSDSVTTKFALELQLNRNGLQSNTQGTLQFLPATERPDRRFDLVLIKLPKNLQYLQDCLIRLRENIDQDTVIIAGGMVKHWSKGIQSIFENNIGPSHTSLARKKARLLFSNFDASLNVEPADSLILTESSLNLVLKHYSNVYGQSNLDAGARLMIGAFSQQLSDPFVLGESRETPSKFALADLACGNGVLGIMLQRYLQKAIEKTKRKFSSRIEIDYIDESFMAINSAKKNAEINLNKIIGRENNAELTLATLDQNFSSRFVVSNVFDQVDAERKYDCIVCNPPFHQEHTITHLIADKCFKESFKRLKQGGQLWVVGNRHLNYHNALKPLFGQVKTIASNKKFVVLLAKKR